MVQAQSVYDKPFSTLQKLRHQFIPGTPACIADVQNTKVTLKRASLPIKEELFQLFPTLLAGGADAMQELKIVVDPENGKILKSDTPLRIGCVLSGGQAAGGHNVIMGLYDMAKKLHPESRVFGFLAGPAGIFNNKYMEITDEYMGLYRNTGGFDMIRSGRDKIEKPDQFEKSLANVTALDLDGLAVIGGDDSNTNACLLAEYFHKNNSKCKVIGCPKTIDGDLKNDHIPVSFGFDTATKVYSEAIGNLCTDAVSGKDYYYFIRLMGRSASHIALECALRNRVNCVLIGEEVKAQKQTLVQITQYVADIVCKRSSLGKNYGVVLVPEGLIEFIPEVAVLIGEINEIVAQEFTGDIREHVVKSLSESSAALFNFLPQAIANQLLLDRDPHGNVQVSKIDTEKLLILLLKKELAEREKAGTYKGRFNPQSHFFGYEGRCALPSNFDSQYCYSLGLNAAVLIREGLTGYMSCVTNLTDKNPSNWQAAGCPLPTMMGVERRSGKDKPVISKALVELDGGMFLAYKAVRDKWAYLDCYVSPGPIQFKGAASDELNFMVLPPDVSKLVEETDRVEALEKSGKRFARDVTLLSELSQARTQDTPTIPTYLEQGTFTVAGSKKYTASTQQIKRRLDLSFPILKDLDSANYFVEVQDVEHTNTKYRQHDQALSDFNEKLLQTDKSVAQKIGVVYMGRQAPGGNNIIDGLLRFQAQRQNVTLYGFINGVEGLLGEDYEVMTRETFAPYLNLGGYDYTGRGSDRISGEDQKAKALEVCKKLGLTGLILVGATANMSECAYLAEYFMSKECQTRVVMVPATVDGNIHHEYFQTSIGFDTASKVYSQLIGNMLTDSASAIKYWYFIRLMGKEPSHLALECALKTQPNMVIVSEECQDRRQNLNDIVNNICDAICMRADDGKNYGCVLIPEGLLSYVASFNMLIKELNQLFLEAKSDEETAKLQEKLQSENELQGLLTPWSLSLFTSLPDFFRTQLLINREVEGSVKLSQVETEKLLAYLVDKELKQRKAAGKYNKSFAPVTHYFGYQGRCAHPSLFDCSLGSTSGFAAGALLEAGLTGVAVSVRQVTEAPEQWRVGAVPILALVKSHPRVGFKKSDLVVRSEDVDLDGNPFQQMKAQLQKWKQFDMYKNPGPIQYKFDKQIDAKLADTLHLMYDHTDNLVEEIRGLCQSIQNDCLFSEHEHLLHSALAQLKSAKFVMNSITYTKGVNM